MVALPCNDVVQWYSVVVMMCDDPASWKRDREKEDLNQKRKNGTGRADDLSRRVKSYLLMVTRLTLLNMLGRGQGEIGASARQQGKRYGELHEVLVGCCCVA